jgi:hypothetical protein
VLVALGLLCALGWALYALVDAVERRFVARFGMGTESA